VIVEIVNYWNIINLEKSSSMYYAMRNDYSCFWY